MRTIRALAAVLLALQCALLLPSMLQAQEASTPADTERLAVADFEVFLVNDDLGRGVAELLRSQLSGSDRITLIERAQLVKVLEEQALQQSGIIAPEQAIETGRILGANKMVIGSVGKLGVVVVLNARVVDVKSGTVDQAWSLSAQSESQLAQTVGDLAAMLTSKRAAPGKAPAAPAAPAATPARLVHFATGEGVSGTWMTEWYDGRGKHPGCMQLKQDGDEVTGWTVEGIGPAEIEAKISGASLRGEFEADYGDGDLEFTISENGSQLIGSYRGGGDQGTWNAWRRNFIHPKLSVGARVLADWDGDVWSYSARITQVDGSRANVTYEDGTVEWLPADRLFTLDFQPGDVVQVAQIPFDAYKNATVTGFTGAAVQVEYFSGQRASAELRDVRALRVRAGGY